MDNPLIRHFSVLLYASAPSSLPPRITPSASELGLYAVQFKECLWFTLFPVLWDLPHSVRKNFSYKGKKSRKNGK